MDRHSRLLPSLALGLLCTAAAAQDPSHAPPWWGVQDNVTVSLYWSFNAPFPPGQPTLVPDLEIVPPWYNNPAPVTAWTASANIVHIPILNGHIGVLGLVGNGTPLQADLSLTVDNDPHLDWIKIFWFQFEEFEGASGDVSYQIAEDLGEYGRANVSERREDIGNGWELVTISAELIPQPDDEQIDWTFLETAFGTAAIDNLYVSSKCVKPRPDEDGDALGKRATPPINLTVATGGRVCRAVAVTRGSAISPGRKYWVSTVGINAGSPNEIVQLNTLGVPTGTNTVLPSTALQAPLGATDLAVERISQTGLPVQEWVYAIVDRRSIGGQVVIRAINANNGALSMAQAVTLVGFPPAVGVNQPLGLAFDPSGQLGLGTFWVTAPAVPPQTGWRAYEFDRGGLLRDQQRFPNESNGLAYDDTLGNFYSFSSEPVMTPNNVAVQVNGFEISGYGDTFEETGVRFCGDLTLPNPMGPPGGIASGLSAYRTFGSVRSELRLVCVVQVQGSQILYELSAPFRYGYSRYGRCGMRNGPPFLGGSFDVTLSGVPTSLLAAMFLGVGPTIVPLSQEQIVSILPSVASPFLTPTTPGEFSLTVNLPNTPTLAYAEAYFQWVVLDSTAPGLIGFSQAGKTVIYP